MKKTIYGLFALISTVSILIYGCSESQEVTGGGTPKISSSLGAELIVEDASLLVGEMTKLTLKAFIKDWRLTRDPKAIETNITMLFKLPDNLEYVSGDIRWQGDIKGNRMKEIQITVRAKEPSKRVKESDYIGYVEVSGTVGHYEPGYTHGGWDSKKICIVNFPQEQCTEEIINETAEAEAIYIIGNIEPPVNPESGGKKK